MKWKAAILAATLLVGCNGIGTGSSLGGVYGSLAFSGSVDHRVDGTNHVYVVRRLDLEFDPDAGTNRTDRITNPSLLLVATTRAPDGAQYRTIFESRVPVHAQLDASNRRASVQGVEFVVPDEIVDAADRVGFAITDDRLMWPISTGLKD